MQEKKEYGVKIHQDSEISPCVMMYQLGWTNTIYTVNTGEVWSGGKNQFYFKIPKSLRVGDEIQITARLGNSSRWKRFRLINFNTKRLRFEMTGSSSNSEKKKKRIEDLEKRIEALEGFVYSPLSKSGSTVAN